MTISEYIERIKPHINFDFSKEVQATLFPIDKFVKTATEDALITLGSRSRIIEKSVLVPIENNVRSYNVITSFLSKSKFSISKIKQIIFINSDGATLSLTHEWFEDIQLNKQWDDVLRIAVVKSNMNNQLRLNLNIEGSELPHGFFDSIETIPSASVINLTTDSLSTVGSYVINLEGASNGLYDWRQILSVNAGDATMNNNVTGNATDGWLPFDWSTSDKVYVCSQLPWMALVTFQGVVNPGYFSTENDIPIPNTYMTILDSLVVANLYNYMASRIPQAGQIYQSRIQTGLLMPVPMAILEARKIANHTIDPIVVKCYEPYPHNDSEEYP